MHLEDVPSGYCCLLDWFEHTSRLLGAMDLGEDPYRWTHAQREEAALDYGLARYHLTQAIRAYALLFQESAPAEETVEALEDRIGLWSY